MNENTFHGLHSRVHSVSNPGGSTVPFGESDIQVRVLARGVGYDVEAIQVTSSDRQFAPIRWSPGVTRVLLENAAVSAPSTLHK